MKLHSIESSPIIVRKLTDEWWELDEVLIITLNLEVGVIKLKLDKGFKTDFGSIPKLFQNWIDRANDNLLAFIAHDAGYVFGGLSRETWDDLLRQSLRSAGMGYWKALSVYKAVDWFGEDHFKTAPEEQMSKVHLRWDSE
jgi:hypothetical protein